MLAILQLKKKEKIIKWRSKTEKKSLNNLKQGLQPHAFFLKENP